MIIIVVIVIVITKLDLKKKDFQYLKFRETK